VVPEPKPISSDPRYASEKIDQSKLTHLQPEQRQQLLNLLDRYSACFSDIPGFCSLIEHEVPLADTIVPKRLAAYKIAVHL